MKTKSVQKCSTRQSFIFPKWHSFKIGTLVCWVFYSYINLSKYFFTQSQQMPFYAPCLTSIQKFKRWETSNGQVCEQEFGELIEDLNEMEILSEINLPCRFITVSFFVIHMKINKLNNSFVQRSFQ